MLGDRAPDGNATARRMAPLAGAAVLRALAGTLAAAGCAAALAAAPALAAARGVTIAWGGDVTLGSSYGLPPQHGWPQLAPVKGVLRAADVAAVNYEGTFGSGGASKCGGPSGGDCFAFQAPARNARTLARAGVDIVNQANNHAHDYGPEGARRTRAALAAAGVAATGAPGELRVLRARGRRIAFVGFSTYGWSASMNDPAGVADLVRRADRAADLVVTLFHGGAEGAGHTHVPHGHEHAFGEDRGDARGFARTAIRAGADLVLGSGPHVLRGMELYRGRLIAYSLGNLTGWKNFGTGGLLSYSALLTAELSRSGRLAGGAITSLRLDATGVPRVDPTGGAERLMKRLGTDDFGAAGVSFEPFGEFLSPPLLGLA
jgi:Bacterial capsule synthesis protein PGA_cap